jgi:hypothetical protein
MAHSSDGRPLRSALLRPGRHYRTTCRSRVGPARLEVVQIGVAVFARHGLRD